MILKGASAVYGAAAGWRRRWYTRDPARRRRLAHPVISIGNLSSGGRGKTPVVGVVAALLREAGERPAILSRGYARRSRPEGVTVVSDAARVVASVDTAGDEPLMLARALPGVPVLVADDRYLAGVLAESTFAATVHVLDDGFQHLGLARDVDLLLVDDRDLEDDLLPAGRLREPIETLRLADAVLASPGSSAVAARVASMAPGLPLFGLERRLGPPAWRAAAPGIAEGAERRVFAVAGIARPDRFFDDLAAAGWDVAGTRAFADHHWFSAADVAGIERAAVTAGARAILTTAKDGVRLDALACEMPIGVVPLVMSIHPPAFSDWLLERVSAARRAPAGGGRG